MRLSCCFSKCPIMTFVCSEQRGKQHDVVIEPQSLQKEEEEVEWISGYYFNDNDQVIVVPKP